MSEDRTNGEIVEQLKRLQPARSELDSRIVFYEAGFSVGKTQQTAPARFKIAPLIAAGLLAAIVSAPASYRVGQHAAMQADSTASVIVAKAGANPAAVVMEDLPHADPSPHIERMNHAGRAERLASWIDPLQLLAETVRIERQTGTTLAAFHSSLVQRENSAVSYRDFPFPLTSTTDRDSYASAVGAGVDSTPPQPLAVSDLPELAMSLEGTR